MDGDSVQGGEKWVLTAKRVAFEEATGEIRTWLATITLEQMFRLETWRQLSFFARVRPENNLCPVRTVYNGETTNIGLNYLTSDKPIWMAGPDIVVSILLTGKVPHIEKAIRMVPHGKQLGLTPTTLRGLVPIDPRREDFFRRVGSQSAHVGKDLCWPAGASCDPAMRRRSAEPRNAVLTGERLRITSGAQVSSCAVWCMRC